MTIIRDVDYDAFKAKLGDFYDSMKDSTALSMLTPYLRQFPN